MKTRLNANRSGFYSDGQDSYRTNVEEENQIIDLGYDWDTRLWQHA